MYKNITKLLAICLLAATSGLTATAEDGAAETNTLYERLGGWDGINQVVQDTVALHHENPKIAHYFADIDEDQLIKHVTDFFATGTGGPATYEGRDMTSTHASMGLSEADFDSAVADVLSAVDKNGIDAASKGEVAAILESLRPAVMGSTGS